MTTEEIDLIPKKDLTLTIEDIEEGHGFEPEPEPEPEPQASSEGVQSKYLAPGVSPNPLLDQIKSLGISETKARKITLYLGTLGIENLYELRGSDKLGAPARRVQRGKNFPKGLGDEWEKCVEYIKNGPLGNQLIEFVRIPEEHARIIAGSLEYNGDSNYPGITDINQIKDFDEERIKIETNHFFRRGVLIRDSWLIIVDYIKKIKREALSVDDGEPLLPGAMPRSL